MYFNRLALSTTLATALFAVAGTSVAADPTFSNSRQQRMDAAYENYRNTDRSGARVGNEVDSNRSSDLSATGNVREDARRFGKGMKRGAKQTGQAIAGGAREAGGAIADGARDTGRAVRDTGKRAKNAVTGKN